MNIFKQLWRLKQNVRRMGGWQAIIKDGPKFALLLRRLLADPRVPLLAKAALVGGVVFAFSPLNLPQFIPILGQLDELGIVLFVGNFFFKQVPADVLTEHRQAVGLRDWSAA